MVQSDSKKKVTKKDEIVYACEEVNCNSKCLKKASPKCSKSEGCMKERAKICKKRCRRARCEARCKDEPQLGYVEREMKIEKCKEACQTPKCKTKCDEEFQSCKSKCFSKAHKFICPDLPPPEPIVGGKGGSSSGESDSMSESDLGGESSDDSSADFGGSLGNDDDAPLDFASESMGSSAAAEDDEPL